jgi:large subunit ribosomal protein L15
MARRVKSKKSKYLGNRSYGGGNTKNRRGKGNKGGKGRAGWHKHKWLKTIKSGEFKNRKRGFHSTEAKPASITLQQVASLISTGKFPKEGNVYQVKLDLFKVVSSPEFTIPANITAVAFSKNAKQLVEKAGGKATALRLPKKPKAPKPAAAKKA